MVVWVKDKLTEKHKGTVYDISINQAETKQTLRIVLEYFVSAEVEETEQFA